MRRLLRRLSGGLALAAGATWLARRFVHRRRIARIVQHARATLGRPDLLEPATELSLDDGLRKTEGVLALADDRIVFFTPDGETAMRRATLHAVITHTLGRHHLPYGLLRLTPKYGPARHFRLAGSASPWLDRLYRG